MTINHPVRLNHQVRLAARPTGLATHDDFTFTEEPVPRPTPTFPCSTRRS
jgi:NADPH-dependent curcumin reductase CurA